MNNIKLVFPKIYKVLQIINRFRIDLTHVKINYHDLSEFFNYYKFGVRLSSNNNRFFSNFFNHIVVDSGLNICVIDVGANDGWFAKTVFRFARLARVISYEPLLSQHKYLDQILQKNKNFNWIGKAVGDKNELISITEYGTTGLSSIKGINADYSYSSHYNQSVTTQYEVESTILDNEFKGFIFNNEVEYILKIDTQGYELEVLRGAYTLLKNNKFNWIIIEVMTVSKYSNSALYDEIFNYLHSLNYKLWDINPSYYEEKSNRLTEFDVIFTLEKS
mgnify:CR=1 FL=1